MSGSRGRGEKIRDLTPFEATVWAKYVRVLEQREAEARGAHEAYQEAHRSAQQAREILQDLALVFHGVEEPVVLEGNTLFRGQVEAPAE